MLCNVMGGKTRQGKVRTGKFILLFDLASAKNISLKNAGAHVVQSSAYIGKKVKEVLS